MLVPVLVVNGWLAYHTWQNSEERGEIKNDYSEVNGLEYGVLSVNAWKKEVKGIIIQKIDSFNLDKEQDSIIQRRVSELLYKMVGRADSLLQNNDNTLKTKLRKWGVNLVVDRDNLRKQIPGFSRAIVEELTNKKTKNSIKKIAKDKLNKFTRKTYDQSDSARMRKLFKKYNVSGIQQYNQKLPHKAETLKSHSYRNAFIMLGSVLFFLALWIVVYKGGYSHLRQPLFLFSVILALIVLLVGITSSMIDIDARIEKLDFMLMGHQVSFRDQIIYYRSKSILELVEALIRQKKADSVFVGVLVLCFSMLLPASKLIATEIYLAGSEKLRKNKFLHWLAIKSGKWSMADVMVVAIFMAYVGFDGIMDSQVETVTRNTQELTSIATNNTSLQPGYILFVTFVLFALILSEILMAITRKSEKQKD